MKPLSHFSKKWIIATLFIVCLIPVIHAQNSKTDTIATTTSIDQQKSNHQPAKAGSEAKPKKALTKKPSSNTKSADISQCFANGFLFKKNSLTDI